MKAVLDASPNPFLVSLGDLGESKGAFCITPVPIRPRRRGERRSLRTFAGVSLRPHLAFNTRPRCLSTPLLTPLNSTPTFARVEWPKDCTESKQLYAGTTECFKTVRAYLDGFGHKYDIVGGNHDLEGIDEFSTDKANLAAYLEHMGKETPQFCYEIAPKTLIVGLGSTQVRSIHKFFTHRSVSAFDRVPFQLTDELFLYGMARSSATPRTPPTRSPWTRSSSTGS